MALAVKDRDIEIRGVRYAMIVENGRTILSRYDTLYKMWVTVRFAEDASNDDAILSQVSDMLVDMFANSGSRNAQP